MVAGEPVSEVALCHSVLFTVLCPKVLLSPREKACTVLCPKSTIKSQRESMHYITSEDGEHSDMFTLHRLSLCVYIL